MIGQSRFARRARQWMRTVGQRNHSISKQYDPQTGFTTQPLFVHDEDGESDLAAYRVWVWHAVMEAGGTVVLSYEDFLNSPGATLSWSIDPQTLATTIKAGR